MTAEDLARRMQQRAERTVPELERATRRLGIEAMAASKKLMTAEIYAKPEDRRKNGKKAWTRTGDLRRAEKPEERGLGKVALVNRMVYARRRHNLDYSDLKKKAPYVDRTAHWRTDLLREFEPRRQEIMREMISRILRG